ncbi:hypothetical protein V6Z12_D03G128900 [Gossypium hirsutum]
MHFVYVFLGWEASIADGRVLRDAISRRHGLKVSHDSYVRVFTIKCFFPKFSRNQKEMGSRRRCCVGFLYGQLAQCWNL